jgi:hypothetical protein
MLLALIGAAAVFFVVWVVDGDDVTDWFRRG